MTTMTEPSKPVKVKESWKDIQATYLFWSWNLIFITFVIGGFLPTMLPDLIRSVRSGWISPIYVIFMVILGLIPLASVAMALALLGNVPKKIFALGYVVEGPLMLMLMFRFFAIRQDTAVMTLMMVAAGIGMLVFVWHLLLKAPPGSTLGRWLLLAGLSLLACAALYAALVLLFYIPPLVILILRAIGQIPVWFVNFFRGFDWTNIAWILFSFMGTLLLLFSGTLIVGMPVAAPWLALKAWLQRFGELRRSRGALLAVSALLPLALVIAAVFVTMRQPQREVYQWLKTPPASVEQAHQLLSKSDEIRSGLVNAYLASYRYFSAEGEVSHVRFIYEETLKLKENSAYPVQRVFEFLVRPLLYVPFRAPDPLKPVDNQAFVGDQQEAGRLYKQFFDADIVRAERDEMVRAARATYNGEQAEAAWQAVDDRSIHMNSQEVTVTGHGDWADVEIYEVYKNETQRQQEVVYYFSLPESAVITGLYLGNSADRSQRFPYRVAPRGAAQAAYRNEIRIRMDPALVEQIGPRQYRLRVFPVQPITFQMTPSMKELDINNAPLLHMWLSYRTLAVNGVWPLPQLAEKRNVFWDQDTLRTINGRPSTAGENEWFPPGLPSGEMAQAGEHRVTFTNGQTVVARPLGGANLPVLPAGIKLAVVLDRSRSMNDRASLVEQALAGIQQVAGEQVDVYLTSSAYRGEPPSRVALARLDLDQVLYYGGQNAADLLSQFETLQGDTQYDAVLVLTDGTGYEIGGSDVPVSVPNSPVWVVHVDGKFPLGYDDPTLDAINGSGGGVTGSVEEALQRIAVSLDGRGDVIDGYLWQMETGSAAVTGQDEGFRPLAARRLVLSEMRSHPGAEIDLSTLDHLQTLAVENSIVTPFSSMIVLVEERQKLLLDQMEKYKDRFDREVEQVGETAPLGMIAGVPEPEEWLLIGLAALVLAYAWWSRRAKSAPQVRG